MALVPQIITEDRASGAQVIDGSLIINKGEDYLKRTPSSAGNQKTWTWSAWVKRDAIDDSTHQTFFSAGDGSVRTNFMFDNTGYTNPGTIQINYQAGQGSGPYSSKCRRDFSGFYHIVVAFDTTQATAANRIKCWVNGVEDVLGTNSFPNQNTDWAVNDDKLHTIGMNCELGEPFGGRYTNCYLLDGVALSASYFGYTDPLTGTWRPKKFIAEGTTVNNGTTWSSGGDDTNINSSYPWTKAFDGITDGTYGNGAGADDGDGWARWTPTGGVVVKDSLRINTDNGTTSAVKVKFSGAGVQHLTSLTDGWNDVSKDGSILEYIEIYNQSTTWSYLCGVEVDGIIMKDGATQNIDYGTNGFYLPMDGSTPIGEDQSGKGNDWTPHNLSDAVSLNKATGGLPILNTVSGGKVASAGVRTDSNYSSCLLALPLVGNTIDYSNKINSGSTTKTATASGASAYGGPWPAGINLYSGSYKFDGSNDEIVISSTDFSPGTGPFTIELWFNASSLPNTNNRLLTSGNNTSSGQKSHYQMMVKSNGGVEINYDTTAGYVIASAADLVDINEWHHFAMTRDSSSPPKMSIWLDGKEVASGTSNTGFNSNNTEGIVIGRESTGSNWWNGYIQDVRYYNAVCKYTSDFRVGAPFSSIQPSSPSGIVYKSELTKPTSGAVYFNGGTTQYLSTNSTSSDFNIAGDFTVECWVFPRDSSSNANDGIFQFSTTSGGLQNNINNMISMQWESVSASPCRFNAGFNGSWQNSTIDRAAGGAGVNRWYHIAMVRSSGTVKTYVDGVEDLSFSNSDSLSLTYAVVGGYWKTSPSHLFEGFISNFRFVNGTAVYTSAFTPPSGPLTDITNTKLLCCQSSTSPTAALVTPVALTVNGSSIASSSNLFDSGDEYVLGKATSYCTLNPLSNGGLVLSNGNLKVAEGSGPHMRVNSTIGVSSGKWYYELTNNSQPYDASGVDTNSSTGLTETSNPAASSYPGSDATSYAYQYASDNNGTKLYTNGSNSSWPTTSSTAGTMAGGVVMVAFDLDNSKIWFGRYGNWLESGNPVTGANPAFTLTSGKEYTPTFRPRGTGGTNATVNFGQTPFKYPPPEGFSPLCNTNLPTPAFTRPEQYMRPITWTGGKSGSGGLTRQISTNHLLNAPFPEKPILFQPDMLWIKQRNQAYSTGWQIYDSVRGGGAEKEINCSGIAVEGAGNIEAYGWLESFDKNGFTVKGGSTDYDYVDKSGVNYVAYGWKAGGNKNTFNIDDVGYSTAAAAGMDGGDINPTGCSVGTKQGFSILKYSGNGSNSQSINHGLGAIPDFVICKNLGTNYNWFIWHNAFGNGANAGMYFTTGSIVTNYNTQPFGTFTTSSLVFNGVNDGVCGNYDYICYAWKNIPGVQKFGQYKANNNADGPYVELGFKPALVCIKSMTTSGTARNWALVDSTRSYANVANHTLAWNLNNAEADFGPGVNIFGGSNRIDLLSDGFKIRDTGYWCNESGATYIYMAWAESPFHNLYGGQSNAR